MIGTELLQLLQGDPLAQMRQQMAGPNPNPQAPQQPQTAARAKAVTAGHRTGSKRHTGRCLRMELDQARLWGRRRRCRQAYPPIR